MSGLEVVAAVAAVVSAFHGGAELLSLVKKKRRARKIRDHVQQEFEENQLEFSLVTGEQQIGLRYAQDQRELGAYMRVGDVVARDRLIHIALIMQAEIIKSLQLAATHDNAVLNLRILYQTSIANQRETFVTLDELKQRILVTRTLARQISGSHDGLMYQNPSVQSLQTIRTLDSSPTSSVPGEYIPRAITMPTQNMAREGKHGLSEFFRTKRSREPTSPHPLPHSAAHAANINFSAALEELVRSRGSEDRSVILKDIDQIIGLYKGLDITREPIDPWDRNQYSSGYLERRDTLTMLNNGESDRPGFNRQYAPGLRSSPLGDDCLANDQGHPAYSQNMFDAEYGQPFDQQYNDPQYTGQSLHPSQQPHLQQPRWSDDSGTSSVTSNPMLRHNSGSSHGSNMQPVPNAVRHSPYTDQARFPNSSPLPNAPLSGDDEGPYSQSSYHAPSDQYTLPIAPLAPFRAASQPNTSLQSVLRHDASMKSRSMSHGDKALPIHKPWPGSQQDTSPMSHACPATQHATTDSLDDNTCHQTEGPRHTTLHHSPTPSPGIPSSSRPRRSPPPSGFDAILTAATALTHGVPIRHPSIASTTSTTSTPLGILPSARLRAPLSPQPTPIPLAPPSKSNNYHGFCKGAWKIRDLGPTKGLVLRCQPSGYYNTKQMWQCTACRFQGGVFVSGAGGGGKKEKGKVVDPRVHVDVGSGVRYRWVFLAKSHVKVRDGGRGGTSTTTTTLTGNTTLACTATATITAIPTGTLDTATPTHGDGNANANADFLCIFCTLSPPPASQAQPTTYPTPTSLLTHISRTHIADMTDAVRREVKCVLGRVAGADEDWDLNVPIFEVGSGAI